MPRILNLPPKLLPLTDPEVFNKYRYFLIKGGRGGAKSQSIGRLVLYLSEKYNLRVVCGRETQNSIRESVHSLLSDLVREFQLNFQVQDSCISSRVTTTEINFRGFREQGKFNVQGMEGIDLVWIDESQAITKATLDVLIPTIRKDNARIIFTMNPHVFNDAVVEKLEGRSDCLVIHLNFDDNPHCTEALKREAAECKKQSENDYRHIWLGEPLDQSDDAVFSSSDIERCQKNPHILSPGYGIRLGGFDIARFGSDKCADFIIQQMGALHWEEFHVDEWGKADLNYTTGRILTTANEQNMTEGVIDEDGLGAGPLDTLQKGRSLNYFYGFRNLPLNYKENRYFANVRTLNAFKARDLFAKGHLNIRDKVTIKELLTAFKYTFDHYQRRILIDKDVMKTKYKIASPNRADALIMAVSRIGEVKANQERPYEPKVQTHSSEDNLFKIAGIR